MFLFASFNATFLTSCKILPLMIMTQTSKAQSVSLCYSPSVFDYHRLEMVAFPNRMCIMTDWTFWTELRHAGLESLSK